MKKAKFLLLTLLALLGYSGAWAETVSPYSVDFNSTIATSNHDFAVAPKWGHIVGTGNYDGMGPYYMTYSYSATAGVDGSGTLSASKQVAGDNWGGTECYDLLVTPTVSGTITLQVKASSLSSSSYNAYVEFYATDGTTRGELLKTVKEDIPGYNTGSNTEWITATLEVSSAQKIGIRAQNVYLDNFTATQMEYTAEKSVTVTKVANLAGYDANNGSTTYFDQQANGSLKVQLQVTLSNNGDIDIEAGDVSLILARATTASGAKTYYDDAAVTVNEAIAVGQTVTVDVDFYVPYTSGWAYWYVKESLKGTTSSSYRYAGVNAYEPKFIFRAAGSTSTSSLSGTQAWGTISETTTKNYEIYNDGNAPLIINLITEPVGFAMAESTEDFVSLIHDGYDADGAVWYAWTWNEGEDGVWVAENNGQFTGLREKILFVRMDPAGNGNPNWSYKWNQTADFYVQKGMGYVITGWGDEKLACNTVAAIIPPKGSKAIDLTLNATIPGSYSGTLNVQYFNKGYDMSNVTDYPLGFSASVIAAGTWFADFNSGSSSPLYPEGCIAENGIISDYNYSNGAYDVFIKGRSQSTYASENNKFITPLLHANEGDKLSFELKRGSSSSATYNVKVYACTDRVNWGTPVFTKTADELTSSFQTFEITCPAEGDYYFAFALYDVCLDNVIGLQKVDVDHDLYIKSVTWQDATVNSGQPISSKPSVDIIPLTNETADAYTVKYIYGDNVVEGTSVDLTASANSTKTFTFSFTPEVESTTTFEDTKVVFEFTDGTKFETEPFTFTVKNEPKFHFVKTKPSSKWYEPSDYTTPINFGKTNTADEQSFYIVNWGSAALNVSDITLPAGFSVDVETPLTVAPFDGTNEGIDAALQPITITFSATEAGVYGGDMVITYTDGTGADATFTLAVSGTKLDPNKWYANFDDNAWPAGSVYNGSVSMSNGGTYSEPNYYISSSNGMFISPKLTATEGETLAFDAKLYNSNSSWSGGKVNVYVAATRDELVDTETDKTPIFTTEDMTADYQTFTVTMPEAGDFYLGFEILESAKVDEFYGLTLAPVDYDLVMGNVNVPTEAMQNTPFTATFNVKNFGLEDVEEGTYRVLWVIGDETSDYQTSELEDGDKAITMNHKLTDAGTAFTVSMMFPKVGTYPATIAITDGEGNILAESEPIDVTFTEEVATAEGKQVGTKTSSGRDYGFVDWYNNDGSTTRYTDILYTAEKIAAAGINAGDKIVAISFKASNSAKEFKAVVTSWVGTSTGDITYGSPSKGDMTEVSVYNGTVSFPANVESVIDLSTSPIVWDGESDIRVYTEAVGQGSGNWMSANYDYDTEITMSYNGSTKAGTVAYFTLAVEPATISGTVTDEDENPIEGATVTLESEDEDGVMYEGTTDETGAYSISVIQSGRTYTATVTKEGYDAAEETGIEFSEGDPVIDFVLTQTPEFITLTIKEGFDGTTIGSKYPLDFSAITDLTVYKVTGTVGAKTVYIVTDELTEGVVPAEEGILVKGPAGTYQIPVVNDPDADNEFFDDNLLVAAIDGYTVTEDDIDAKNMYRYGKAGGKCGFQLVTKMGQNVGAGKAYLRLTEALASAVALLGIEGDDMLEGTTGIDALYSDTTDENTPMFNTAGQRVQKSYKGVVIQNGKKFIKK